VSVDVSLAVALPATAPTGDGLLGGVPSQVAQGASVTVTGDGFLPGTTITLGIYSTPTSLGTASVDASGAFSATVTIPITTLLGAHTIAAAGVSASGDARTLAAPSTVVAAGTGSGSNGSSGSGGGTGATSGSGSTSGATSDGLSSTGGTVPIGLIVGGLLAAAVGAILVWRVRRER
jgi:hypothetical protein